MFARSDIALIAPEEDVSACDMLEVVRPLAFVWACTRKPPVVVAWAVAVPRPPMPVVPAPKLLPPGPALAPAKASSVLLFMSSMNPVAAPPLPGVPAPEVPPPGPPTVLTRPSSGPLAGLLVVKLENALPPWPALPPNAKPPGPALAFWNSRSVPVVEPETEFVAVEAPPFPPLPVAPKSAHRRRMPA